MTYRRMEDLDLGGKRVLIREDLNVPVAEGEVRNDTRIRATMPTIAAACKAGAEVMLMSHLGRPEEGKPAAEQPQFSLQPVARCLQALLNNDDSRDAVRVSKQHLQVQLIAAEDYLDGKKGKIDKMPRLGPGCIALLENVRFNQGEAANADDLAKKYAALCDIFVMDAFGTAHRAQASTHGVARYAPAACAGPLLSRELDTLSACLEKPKRPMLAIVGGAKVSSKLKVLQNLASKVDQLIVGGGIANTFLAAAGHPIGRSLHEPDLIPTAKELMTQVNIPLPTDVVVAERVAADVKPRTCSVEQVRVEEMILDIGPKTIAHFAATIKDMQTILWNGPLGVFELAPFAEGTRQVARAIADSDAFSIAGGGETVTAIAEASVADRISYISTGGGAFLEYVQGTELPAVQILKERAKN